MQALINSIKTFPLRRPLLFGVGFSCARSRRASPANPRFMQYCATVVTGRGQDGAGSL